MTGHWPWIIVSFGFLLSLRGLGSGTSERSDLSFRSYGREIVDFFISMVLVVTVYNGLLFWDLARPVTEEFNFALLWAMAYPVAGYQKKSPVFFMSTAIISHAVVSAYDGLLTQASFLGIICAGIFFFRVAFYGLSFGTRFKELPQAMKGWPALCLFAFCIAVVMNGIFGLIF